MKCDDESIAWSLLLLYFLIFSTIIFEIDIQIQLYIKEKFMQSIDLISFFGGLGSRVFKKLSSSLCFVVKDKNQSLVLPTKSLYSTRFLSKKNNQYVVFY